MLKKSFLFLPLLLACAITTQLSCMHRTSTADPSASPSLTEQQKIDEILQRYEQAIGGKEAIDAIKNVRMKGTFELPGISGTIEGWGQESPKKSLLILQFPRLGTLKKGFDGETHWVQTPAGTFTDSNPREIAEMDRDAQAFSASNIRSQFDTMKLENKARLSGRDVYMIEGKPAKGPAEKLFFDVENGLLLRWDMARRQQERRTVFVKVHLEDYKDVGAVKIPFKYRFAFEQFNLIYKVDEMEHNIAMDEAMFRKP